MNFTSLSIVITGNYYSEPHDNAGPSSLNLSSDQSETRPLVNTTDRSLSLLLLLLLLLLSLLLLLL